MERFFLVAKKKRLFWVLLSKSKGDMCSARRGKNRSKTRQQKPLEPCQPVASLCCFFCGLGVGEKKVDLTFFPFFLKHLLWRFLLDCDMFRIVILFNSSMKLLLYHSSSQSLKVEYVFWFSGTWLVKIWISWFLWIHWLLSCVSVYGQLPMS